MTVARSLGVPYARAARFEGPELIDFDPTQPFTHFGPAAPQPIGGPLGEIVPGMGVGETDEARCLTLNVFAPEGAHDLPVLVWFPGGSFVIGAAAQTAYDGTLLANEQRVVVVTVNYRLGALGFLDARLLGGVANCGLRDALCALQWVRDHIASFGGDPSRVVAFGESAGGGLVLHMLASPASHGLLAGAIVQSGATFATLDDSRAALVVEAVCKAAAVGDPGELRTLSVDALVAAQSSAMGDLLGSVGMMPFHPMVDGDVLTTPPVEALRAGTAAGVPLIAGTTADEMALFVDRTAAPPARERLIRRVARYLDIDDSGAGDAVDGYIRALATDDTATVWQAIFGDREMQVPCRAVVDAQARHAPAFTYLFTWEGPGVGACHGIDIPFTFGNFVDGWDAFVDLDDDGRALSRTMRDAWAAFARTGDPGWPAYPNAMILGRSPHVTPSHPLFARERLATNR